MTHTPQPDALPLISIVLCTYNGAAFVQAQLQSLLQQTYPRLEIVVSDDASTDGTQQVLKSFEGQRGVRLFFSETNRGPIENFAFVMAQAQGRYIAFCDQDDVWLPHKVEKLYEAIGPHWLVYCDSELVDEEGRSLHRQLSQLRRMYSGTSTRGFVFSNVVWGHNILMDRRLLPQVLPIPQGVPHDIWIGFRAAMATGIRYLDLPLTLYRQHAQSVTKTIAAPAAARTSARRYADFEGLLYWIGIMGAYERPGEKAFYDRLYRLYAARAGGRFQWPLLFFLLRYRRDLFRFSRKRLISQVLEIRKHCRGVRR